MKLSLQLLKDPKLSLLQGILTEARKKLNPQAALSVCSTAKRISPDLRWQQICSLTESKLHWQLGQEERAVWLLSNSPLDDSLVSSKVLTRLAKWSMVRKSLPTSQLVEKYLRRAFDCAGDNLAQQAKLHFMLATVSSALYEGLNLNERKKLLNQARDAMQGKSRGSAQVEANLKRDWEEYEALVKQSNEHLGMAMDGFLQTLALSNKHDYCAFRLCSLWFKECENPQVMASIQTFLGRVPSAKFIPLIYQLSARLSVAKEGEPLVKDLVNLLLRLCTEHPHQSLIQILALRGEPQRKSLSKRKLVDETEEQIHELWARLKATMPALALAYERLVAAYVELSNVEVSKEVRIGAEVPLDPKLLIYRYSDFGQLPLLTASGGVSLRAVSSGFKCVGGINLPKIIDITGSDGKVYRQLVKGRDDLRQDAVMEQVFKLVHRMLQCDKRVADRHLGLRTYRVIPLYGQVGVLEWVNDTSPLGELILGPHDRLYPADMSSREAREMVKREAERPGSTPASKLQVYQEVCQRFQPAFRHYFFESTESPQQWYRKRLAYIRSTAACSMVGHVVGLGDRHLQNLLLDRSSGELILIDLNMIFDGGRILRIPERVPFRLTRNMLDPMGVQLDPADLSPCFLANCQATLQVMRQHADNLLMILEVFKHDPLYKWATRVSGDSEAERALLRVREKLTGFEEGCILSERATAIHLCNMARDPNRLSQMYVGWQPWV